MLNVDDLLFFSLLFHSDYTLVIGGAINMLFDSGVDRLNTPLTDYFLVSSSLLLLLLLASPVIRGRHSESILHH